MLVLTRKVGEQIRIGDEVIITVVRTKGKAVRLGIQAPAHVPVLRGEIAAALAADQEPAAAEENLADEEAHHPPRRDAQGVASGVSPLRTLTRGLRLPSGPASYVMVAPGV
ncbi:MAG: hypothetical protein DCC67_17120 [Planctomycetota bacterium]|nr:MAG: hypothetical protein DCC67_17120 [Planctomycetota bacterium]